MTDHVTPALLQELYTLRDYEERTRDTICWGVSCVHQAEALSWCVRQEEKIDKLKAVAALASQVVAAYGAGVECDEIIRDLGAAITALETNDEW